MTEARLTVINNPPRGKKAILESLVKSNNDGIWSERIEIEGYNQTPENRAIRMACLLGWKIIDRII